MRTSFPRVAGHSLLAFLLSSAFALAAAPSFKLTPVSPKNDTAIYQPGDKIAWRVEALNDEAGALKSGSFTIKQGGAKVLAQGNVTFGPEPTVIEASLNEPGTLLAMVEAPLASGTTLNVGTGATVLPSKLGPSAPAPDDFDAFWKGKIAELTAIPENAVFEKGESGDAKVDYWKITMDNIRGTHVYGQLARPAQGEKFPAMLIVQAAGVYGISKDRVLKPAQEGWLVLNILAHDLPIDQPKAFYDDLAQNALKDYTAIGNTDRETSYFLRMFLSCYRAAEYLSKRPDWNGKVFLVMGTSQGGLQSFVTAALHPKITAVMTEVPAGCDHTGYLAGRKPGWPYWKKHAEQAAGDSEKIMATSRYFDGATFAARIHVPTLIGLGLADITSPASGVFAAYNQIHAPKEIVIMPEATHKEGHDAYRKRAEQWRAALVKGEPAPIQPNADLGK